MEKTCTTSVIMGGLTLGFVLADSYLNQARYMLSYMFLGSITTVLFYLLCLYGYQTINWVFLAILPIYIFFSILSIHLRKNNISNTSDMCNSCEMPEDECECKMPKPKPKPCKPEIKPPPRCSSKPIRIV